MTPEQEAAYVISQSACAMIAAMGMAAQNQLAAAEGASIPYGEYEFNALIEKYGIHHNAVLTVMQR